ncbi:MAG: MerR family transcriptional regulator [Calditrichaeota bacterium]|nr:MAG: MerR family transcriptional regulator [Calditrichota bacterium]
MGEKTYKIGEVSRQLDVAVETIRMYEREGLIVVAKTDTGQRYYNEEDVHWLNCIRSLIKNQGLNIEGIRRLLSLIPCWQIKPCSLSDREHCPAFNGAVKPCWMIKNELGGDCSTFNCRECHVYLNAHECTNLKGLLQKYTKIEGNPINKGEV